ncbi:MAG: polymerase sigma factor CnrH [Bacteroidota bacterium]|jgi:RNA polymerase sigma-70 factor (ECF subfamily)
MHHHSLEELYQLHHERVFNLALHYVQQVEDAEEITQDVFVKVHEKLHTFQGLSEAGTWIYRITINTALDYLRARKANKRAFWLRVVSIHEKKPEQEAQTLNHPGIQLEHKEALQRLLRAINKLPERQRSALILLKMEGLSTEEAARIMELTPKALESLFQRAKAQLKILLEQSKEHE